MKAAFSARMSLVLMVAGLSTIEGGDFAASQVSSSEPYVLRFRDTHRTAIGLIYSPELLASLIAKRPDEDRGGAIVDAINQRTPIVVMWSMPVPPEIAPPPTPPWHISIFPSRNRYGLDKVEPLWITHDGSQMARLDPRVRQGQVGAVAAFPRDVVVVGIRICLYFNLPVDYEKKSARSVDRCADLD